MRHLHTVRVANFKASAAGGAPGEPPGVDNRLESDAQFAARWRLKP